MKNLTLNEAIELVNKSNDPDKIYNRVRFQKMPISMYHMGILLEKVNERKTEIAELEELTWN